MEKEMEQSRRQLSPRKKQKRNGKVIIQSKFDYFGKALEVLGTINKVMSALYYYCDSRQNLGFASRLYVDIYKKCTENQKQYFKDLFKAYKKIPCFDYLWNWYFRLNTAGQSFELESSKRLFNMLINDIMICNDLLDEAAASND
mgnify:CR=1 FL=1